MNFTSWRPLPTFSFTLKKLSGVQNYPQSNPASSLVAVIALWCWLPNNSAYGLPYLSPGALCLRCAVSTNVDEDVVIREFWGYVHSCGIASSRDVSRNSSLAERPDRCTCRQAKVSPNAILAWWSVRSTHNHRKFLQRSHPSYIDRKVQLVDMCHPLLAEGIFLRRTLGVSSLTVSALSHRWPLSDFAVGSILSNP